ALRPARREDHAGCGGARGAEQRHGDERAPPAAEPGCGGRRRVQRRVLAEDRLLELPERRTGLEAELGDEGAPRVGEDPERLRLPARAVEREHLLAAEPLPQRVLRRQRLELGRECRVPAERELRVDPLLDREQAQLLEPVDLGSRERLVCEIGERAAAPQRKPFLEPRQGASRIPAGVRAAALLEESLEPVGVELLRLELEDVAAGARADELRVAERLAQPRDLVVEAVVCVAGRPLRPELVEEAVARDDLVRMEEQDRQERALLRPSDGDDALAVPGLERAEKPELQLRLPPPHGR